MFDVNPGHAAVMVSPAPMLVEIGDALDVTYHAPGGAGERVRIVPRDGDPVVGRDRLARHPRRRADRRH